MFLGCNKIFFLLANSRQILIVFHFDSKGLTATDRHTGRVNLSGKRSKDIYTADVCKQCGFFSIRERKTSSFFWPCHLGHCSFDAGDFLKKKGDIEVVADCFSPTICYSYQLAKSTKLSFSKSFHRAVSPFSKISCDLWGPENKL